MPPPFIHRSCWRIHSYHINCRFVAKISCEKMASIFNDTLFFLAEMIAANQQ